MGWRGRFGFRRLVEEEEELEDGTTEDGTH